jgi:hypothetical protein
MDGRQEEDGKYDHALHDGASEEVKKFDNHTVDERTKSVTIHGEKVNIGMLVTLV